MILQGFAYFLKTKTSFQELLSKLAHTLGHMCNFWDTTLLTPFPEPYLQSDHCPEYIICSKPEPSNRFYCFFYLLSKEYIFVMSQECSEILFLT